MSEVANLHIQIRSEAVSEATKRLGSLRESGGAAEKATAGLVTAFADLTGPMASASARARGVAESAAGLTATLPHTTRLIDYLSDTLHDTSRAAPEAAHALGDLGGAMKAVGSPLPKAADGLLKLVSGVETARREVPKSTSELLKLSNSAGAASAPLGGVTKAAKSLAKEAGKPAKSISAIAAALGGSSEKAETASGAFEDLDDGLVSIGGTAPVAASQIVLLASSAQAASESLARVAEHMEQLATAMEVVAMASLETNAHLEHLSKKLGGVAKATEGPLGDVVDVLGDLGGSSQEADDAADELVETMGKLPPTVEEVSERLRAASASAQHFALQIPRASKELKSLKGLKREAAESALYLATRFKGLIGPLVAAYGAMASFKKMIQVQREFDVLNASLATATGGAENAAIAFEAIRHFAEVTPYDINQLSESFIKLINYGLDPSERALTSYGNTASSMGRSLRDMVDTVASATTGNFESLKSFGIRAKVEGDKVAFTFRGVSTSVRNSASEIEKYLISLGELHFAGAMAKRLGTLDDTFLALGEQYSNLLLNISQTGIGDAISRQIQISVDALTELNDMVASGQMESYLEAIAGQFDLFAGDVEIAFGFVRDVVLEDGITPLSWLARAFVEFPINVRTALALATVYTTAFFDGLGARIDDFRQTGLAKNLKGALDSVFGPMAFEIGDDGSLKPAETPKTNQFDLETELKRINDAREESVDLIMREHLAAQNVFATSIAQGKERRKQYEEERKARQAGKGEDRLAGFKRPGEEGSSSAETERIRKELEQVRESLLTEEEALKESYDKRLKIIKAGTTAESALRTDLVGRLDKNYAEAVQKLAEAKGRELETVRTALRTEEESIRESYERRLEIIKKNTEEGSKLQATLTDRLNAELDKQLKAAAKGREEERQSFLDGLLSEEEMIRASYERRRQQVLNATVLTEEERQAVLAQMASDFEKAESERRQAETRLVLSSAMEMFDGLARLAQGRNREQSEAYKVLFAISKAFSISQATLSIATGIAKAQELGFPANLAEMARVGSLGVSIIGTIQGMQFAGAYDEGGRIPAGKIGLVGEYGPEFIQGPAHVTSRKETRQLIEKAAKGAGEKTANNIRIVNAFDTNVIGDYIGSDVGEEVILNVIKRNQTTIRTLVRGA